MDRNRLKNYLKRAMELEKNKLELEQTLSRINRKYTPKITELDNSEVKAGNVDPGCLGTILGFVAGVLLCGGNMVILLGFTAAGYGVSWYIAKEKGDREISQKKAEIAQKNSKIERQNAANTNSANKKNKMISNSVGTIKSALMKTQTEIDLLYADNFIHPKYRNLIAISSIYEYLDTGRCSSLEGADGAYNIYEMEVRLDRIITRLDMVITNLEQIRANQYYLYTAIQDMKPQFEKVSNAIIENTNKLNEVAVNTAVTAYTAQVIERNQYYGRNWNDGNGPYNDRMNMKTLK